MNKNSIKHSSTVGHISKGHSQVQHIVIMPVMPHRCTWESYAVCSEPKKLPLEWFPLEK